jgi:elongation factor G
VLIEDLETAVARGSVLPGARRLLAARHRHGELLEIITQAFPSPLEHPLPAVASPSPASRSRAVTCDPDGPLLAEVVKTTSDPYVGRISLVRVFSGTLRPDMSVHVSGHGRAARGHPTTMTTSASAR